MMRHHPTSENDQVSRDLISQQHPRSASLLLLGGALLLIYIAVAGRLWFFLTPELDYIDNADIQLFFSHQQLSSMFLKLALLLPSVLCLAAWLSIVSKRRVPDFRFLARSHVLIVFVLVALVVFILVTNFVLQRTEVTDDEPTYDLQAKLLLHGSLYVAPPVEKSFNNVFILPGQKFTGQYQPGHPLMMALGMLMGSAYITIIAFGLLQIILVYKISLALYADKKIAGLASLLMCLSPFFFFTGSTRLSHSTSSFFLYLSIYLFLRASNENQSKFGYLFGLLSGVCVGIAFNVRPLTALAFVLPFGIWALINVFKLHKPLLAKYSLLTLGFGVMLFVTLCYNKAISGRYLKFPYLVYNPLETPGFHALAGGGAHTLQNGVVNLGVNILKVNSALFGFPYSLAFFACFLALKPKLFADRILIGVIAAFSFFSVFYHGMGVSDTGPVYCYELIGILAILSARAIAKINSAIREKWPTARNFLAIFLFISFVFAGFGYNLEKAVQLRALTTSIREPYQEMRAAGIHHAIVFIKSLPRKGYVYGYRNNSPDFDDDIILCRLLGPDENARVIDRFPNRTCYILRYDKSSQESIVSPVARERLVKPANVLQ